MTAAAEWPACPQPHEGGGPWPLEQHVDGRMVCSGRAPGGAPCPYELAPPHRPARPLVVVLTGGGLPGDDLDDPPVPAHAAVLALHRAGYGYAVAGRRLPISCTAASWNEAVGRIAAEAWKAGFKDGAKMHRPAALWVIPDEGEARRFAEFVTAEIDPAYVRQASSPADELLAWWHGERRRAGENDQEGTSQ